MDALESFFDNHQLLGTVLFVAFMALVFLLFRKWDLWSAKRWAAENGYRFVRMINYSSGGKHEQHTPARFIVENQKGLWRVRADDYWEDEGESIWSEDVITLGVSLQAEDVVESNEDEGWSEPW